MLIWHYHYFPICTMCMVPSILPGTLCVVWPFQVQLYSIMWKAGYSPEGSQIYRSLNRTWPGYCVTRADSLNRLCAACSEVVPHWGSRVALHFSSEVVAHTKEHCASWFTPPVIHLHPCMHGGRVFIEHWTLFKQGHAWCLGVQARPLLVLCTGGFAALGCTAFIHPCMVTKLKVMSPPPSLGCRKKSSEFAGI